MSVFPNASKRKVLKRYTVDPLQIMSKEARSKGACWSCRLRRKKCDERRPACYACTTFAVPCFGYDPTPIWADGGERQRAKAEELQIIVREMASLRRRSRKKEHPVQVASLQVMEGAQSEAAAAKDHSILEAEAFVDSSGFTSSQPGQQHRHVIAADLDALTVTMPTRKHNPSVDFLKSDCQANLLMHYLDVVFPNQFPFYIPTSADGGRGWLLHLILRTRPLYHAVLSMAAHHQQLQNREPSVSQIFKTCPIATLQVHRILAINELRSHLDSFIRERAQSMEGNTEVLACIVFLILLEASSSMRSTAAISH